MGNNRFKLSDIIPNAWFYKLMDIGTKPTSTPRSNSKFSKKKLPKATPTSPRHSYYYSSHSVSNTHKILISPLTSKSSNTHFPDPPRKSKTSSKSKRTNASTSIDCSCRFTSSETDIVIDVKSQSCFDHQLQTVNHGLESTPKFDLPPILTKPPKLSAPKPGAAEPATKSRHEFEERTSRGSVSVKVAKQETGGGRRSGSQGFRVRSSSPRLVSRKIQACNRRKSAVPDGFAVVKSSLDPQRDFRDSMVEMIVENNIWSSKDLEHLLACYLSLNSNQYHDLIVKVFEQIWFDLTGIRKLRSEFDS